MKFNSLISEDGKCVSKGSIGMWITMLVLIVTTVMLFIGVIDTTTFTTLSSTWSSLLLIFAGYKTVDKGQANFFNNKKSSDN